MGTEHADTGGTAGVAGMAGAVAGGWCAQEVEAAEDHLAALQKSLAGRMATLDLVNPGNGATPYLKVVSKTSSRLGARIWAAPTGEGWVFRWEPWASLLGPVEDPDAVAAGVVRVLGGEE